MKECEYPNCQTCSKTDCDMEEKDIHAMLKRRIWAHNHTAYRQKQRDYRARIKATLPHRDECESRVLVKGERSGYRRLCIDEMRLIEQKVSNCPLWCRKRGNGVKVTIRV